MADDQPSERDVAVRTLQREVTALVRRARARSQALHPELSLVDYSLLEHISATGGCRAADLVTHFQLDRSTISRQLRAMHDNGLVVRQETPGNLKSQLLVLTGPGREALARADAKRLEALAHRLAGWDLTELTRFAALMARYNAE